MFRYRFRTIGWVAVFSFLFSGCVSDQKTQQQWEQLGCLEKFAANNEWSNETEIEITGYAESAMEPQISADENTLFFNNKTDSDKEMDIFFAVRTDAVKFPNRYEFKGQVHGVNDEGTLDGTPAVDRLNNFYWVSMRDYGKNYQTVYSAKLTPQNHVENILVADNSVTRAKFLNIDMGIDVSWDGTLMLISRADFKLFRGYPEQSYLEVADIPFKDGASLRTAARNPQSDAILKEVNWPGCRVYAASLTENFLELYYTVFPMGNKLSKGNFRILVAKRKNKSDPFTKGQIISAIKGEFTEAPSVTAKAGKSLYYHRADPKSGRFKIFKVTRN